MESVGLFTHFDVAKGPLLGVFTVNAEFQTAPRFRSGGDILCSEGQEEDADGELLLKRALRQRHQGMGLIILGTIALARKTSYTAIDSSARV